VHVGRPLLEPGPPAEVRAPTELPGLVQSHSAADSADHPPVRPPRVVIRGRLVRPAARRKGISSSALGAGAARAQRALRFSGVVDQRSAGQLVLFEPGTGGGVGEPLDLLAVGVFVS